MINDETVTLVLPYPPSVNSIWRHRYKGGGGVYLTQQGKDFYHAVQEICAGFGEPLMGRLEAVIDVFPGDRRKRDMDNILKATLDSLTKAHVIGDDSQFDRLLVRRQPADAAQPRVVLTIKELA